MTTLIESRTNRYGIEVRHEGERLRAYRNGRLAAEQRIIRYRTGRIVDLNVRFELAVAPELRAELAAALDEGLRILRDARGLCEVA